MSDDKTAFNDYLEKVRHDSEKIFNLFSRARIYKVPEGLRKLNESAYIPRIIAIGPLHRNEKHLQTPMRGIKRHYINCLFDRLTKDSVTKSSLLEQCLNKMKEKKFVGEVKEFYAKEFTVNDDDLLNKTNEKEFVDKAKKYYDKEVMMTQPVTGGDPILDIILTRNFVKLDLLLLENQIPFFVLEELFKLTVAKIPENKLSLTDYVHEYFGEIMSPEGKNSGSNTKTGCSPSDCALWVNRIEQVSGKAKEYYHILHFLHDSYLPGKNRRINQNSTGVPLTSPLRCPLLLPRCTPPKEKTTGRQFGELQLSALDLDYAGVKFAVAPDRENNQFNINFNEPQSIFSWLFCGAKFEIPTLHIHDPTESFFRNLIALEQCCPGVEPYFTSYAKLMDMLISSKEDVKVLKGKKVIRNHLGTDKDVADLFNKLCKEVVLEEFYFKDQCQDAYKYSQHCWPWFWAQCKRSDVRRVPRHVTDEILITWWPLPQAV
ncbi:hypothetical protein C3L33_20420, partial [Rhododendron williamsianum]